MHKYKGYNWSPKTEENQSVGINSRAKNEQNVYKYVIKTRFRNNTNTTNTSSPIQTRFKEDTLKIACALTMAKVKTITEQVILFLTSKLVSHKRKIIIATKTHRRLWIPRNLKPLFNPTIPVSFSFCICYVMQQQSSCYFCFTKEGKG